jgi:hypothetical protein
VDQLVTLVLPGLLRGVVVRYIFGAPLKTM